MSATDIMDLEDQARLELTLRTRQNIITDLMKSGKAPEDRSDRAFLVQMLDGLDRTVLTKAKIKSDDQAAKNQADSAKLIADALLRVPTRHNTVPRTESLEVIDLPAIEVVDGETSIGVQTFKYDEIMNDQVSQ